MRVTEEILPTPLALISEIAPQRLVAWGEPGSFLDHRALHKAAGIAGWGTRSPAQDHVGVRYEWAGGIS